MQFTIEKEVFLRSLARVQGIVEKRNTIPILSNVLIETTEEGILLTATDLEVGMRSSYPALITSGGKITVSAKKLFEIVKELPEKTVLFSSKENCWIEIRCGKALFNIVGMSSDEFPYFPYPSRENFITFKSSIIKSMIEKTSFAISTDESKYNLNGIYFQKIKESDSNILRLVATDGHRLSLAQNEMINIENEQLEKGVIFPRKGISELKKIAEESDSDIQIGFMDNNAVIKKDTTIILMRLVDGEFPDYTRVVPKSNNRIAILHRDSFLHGLKRMAILSNEKSKGVKLHLSPNMLEISSSNPELGEAREEMEAGFEGQDISIGFNARYLIDILQTLQCEKIILCLRDNLSPGMIQPDGETDFKAVVMPMRL